MKFIDWLYSNYEAFGAIKIDGQWKLLHILTLVLCVGIIILLTFLFKNKNDKSKRIVIFCLTGLILFFEIVRRIINFSKTTDLTFNSVLSTLLPRPWCAISCWVLIISPIINKKFYYNFSSITALICAIIFFAYPGVGFNHSVILFENLYSIATHSLLLITSITLITLKMVDFKYKTCYKEAICYGVILLYSFIEIFLLKIEDDPMYFLPNNDIQNILGIKYPWFLLIYVLFLFIYFNIFYLISERKKIKQLFKKNK